MRSDWEVFRIFEDLGSANVLCSLLLRENVAASVEARSLEHGVEAQYCVCVPSTLTHRARWLLAQLPPTDAELEFLATGRLGGAEEQ